jgi:uncharacterized SAM-binding protein YcdF (DUF218 family)
MSVLKFASNKIFLKFMLLVFAAGLLIYACLPLSVHPPLMQSDAIVLLAGNYAERTPAAAMLCRNGYATRILLTNDGVSSSWSTEYNRNLYQVEWAEQELVALGVPRERIVKLPFYKSATIYDALAVKQYAIKYGLRKIILVTSDYHSRRVLWTFREVFAKTFKNNPVEFTIYPVTSFATGKKEIFVEYCKLFFYWMKYGLFGLEPVITNG